MPNPYNFAPDLSPLLRGLQGYQQRTRQAEQDQLRAQQFQQQQAAAEQQGQLRGLQIQQAEQGIQQQQITADETAAFQETAKDFEGWSDPLQVEQLLMQNPKFAEEIQGQYQLSSQLRKAGAGDVATQAATLIKKGNREGLEALVKNPRYEQLINQIGPSEYTADSFLEEFDKDPEEALETAMDIARMSLSKEDYQQRFGDVARPEYGNIYHDKAGNPIGLNKKTGEYERVKSPAPKGKAAPQTVIDLGGSTEQKELAKLDVGEYKTIKEASAQAYSQLESINQIRAIDTDTGFGTEVKAKAAKVINFLGGDGEALTGVNISDIEKFNAVAEKQVLGVMESQKGPQTDQDADRIKRTVAGIENTKEANGFILNSMEAISNRKIEQEEFWTDFLDKNNRSLKGVTRAWNQYKRSTPMVSDVINNPETGNPMFFYQFRDRYRGKDYDDTEIVEAWRVRNQQKKRAK